MKRCSWTRIALPAAVAALIACAATAALAAPPDSWITAKVKTALLTTRDVPGMPIDVDTYDGRVTLAGHVRTEAERQRAGEIALRTNGVRSVRNLIQVVPKGNERTVKVEDRTLQDRVRHALQSDADLEGSHVAVKSVNRGMVVLAGRASTVQDEVRALEVARHVPGVTGVASEIQTRDRNRYARGWENEQDWHHERGTHSVGYPGPAPRGEDRTGNRRDQTRNPNGYGNDLDNNDRSAYRGNPQGGGRGSDAWITTKVKLKYMTDRSVPAGDINVDTWRGRVTLFGRVPSADVRAQAAREAMTVKGVLSVDNQLVVIPQPERRQWQAEDREIRAAVRARLHDANLPGASIHVDVVGGIVQLSGTVRSPQDRLTAVTIARSTEGSRGVRDDLHEQGSYRAAR